MLHKVVSAEDSLLPQISQYQTGFTLPKGVQEEGIIKSIDTYYQPLWKTLIYYFLCTITVGLWWLVLRWELNWKIKTLMTKSTISKARHLIITNIEGEVEHVQVQLNKGQKFFWFRLYKYVLDNETNFFSPVESPYNNILGMEILNQKGLTTEECVINKECFGQNQTTIPEKSRGKILVDEILSPFYVFQIFSIGLWLLEPYYVYATVIFFSSLASVLVTLSDTRQNYARLRDMSTLKGQVTVFRNAKQFVSVKNGELVVDLQIQSQSLIINCEDILPGDLIQIQDNQTVPCDCVQVNGTSVINESMLTGESVPVIKTPIQAKINYDSNGDSRYCTLFAGTKCVEARSMKVDGNKIPVMAIATQTGFSTMKGSLVRSILFPKPSKFSFHQDAMMFIGVLAIMAVVGTLFTIQDLIQGYNDGVLTMFLVVTKCLDLVTITVPPALPTCLSIGISMALSRLQTKKIFCISPNRINVAGKITIMCFDKTGTLTEEGLDLYGIRSVRLRKNTGSRFNDIIMEFKSIPVDFEEIMAACHGLTIVAGETLGETLELKMFEATNWKLTEEEKTVVQKGNKKITILKRFDFSSTLQRMSVLVENDEKLMVFVKGSPEKLRELCTQNSLPKNFHKMLDFYAKQGFRVLACASKEIDKLYTERNLVECDLTFKGLLIMENKLKAKTPAIIDQLQEANIRTVMVTGDNVLTAISVARSCHIVNAKQRIFLGDIDEKKPDKVIWKDFDMSENALDPETLSPERSIVENPVIVIDEDYNFESPITQPTQGPSPAYGAVTSPKIQEITFQGKISQRPEKSDDGSFAASRKSKKSIKEHQQDMEDDNIDHLVDDAQLWQPEEQFVVAVSGKAFALLQKKAENKEDYAARKVFGIMLEKAQVFARMKPEEKASLVAHLQGINKKALVGMCGDGANDCAALKTADVGISLSEAEASIAAPFTSKIQDISCVVEVLKEGRAALVTSFQCFKYMALYSMIQFTTVTLLYKIPSNLSDWQFLYADLLIIIPLASTMGQTKAYHILSPFQPGSNLVSFPVLLSVIGQTAIQIGFQAGLFYTLLVQSWYVSGLDIHKVIGDEDDDVAMSQCYENTTLFLFANFQYVSQCLVFSIGKPFRSSFYTNFLFTGFLGFIYMLNVYVIFYSRYPSDWLYNLLMLLDSFDMDPYNTKIPNSWLFLILGLALVNSLVSYLFEKYIVLHLTRFYRQKKRQLLRRYRQPENPYLQIPE